ncbi:unnamed protein product [Penicillium camemberti]|uniref:Str. FM013 n=1 Tax=Penicillium camemberti (strain FM 013) TaxID=1429867 RepID=A0A0G4PB06_PENC3|nr:unnamed protein product [Penicillium camemberti]
MGGRLADKQPASANKVPTIRPSVKTATTELFNYVRVESTSQRGRHLLNILKETEQDMRKQRRERLHMDGSHRNDGSSITADRSAPQSHSCAH